MTNPLSVVSSTVSPMLGRAVLVLALCLSTLPAVAMDHASDVDSATLADLPLETLMRVAVTPSASHPVLAPVLAEIHAPRYLAPGVDHGGQQEASSQQRVALFTKRAGGF